MAKLLADYQTRVNEILQDDAGDLTTAEKNAAIENAVKEHSRLRPRRLVHGFTGDGSAYDFALTGQSAPTGYEVGFSRVLTVEFPAGERDPVYLEDEDWIIYEAATETPKLRLLSDTPTSAQTVRINYTARHTVSAQTGTIPDGDFEAVAHFAASFALQSLANKYTQMSESTLGADSVDHRSKALEARANAKAERSLYFEHLGIKEGERPAGMAFKDHDVNYPWGEDRLTHSRRWR